MPGLHAPLSISPSRGTSGATTKSSGGVSRDREYRRVVSLSFFFAAILPQRYWVRACSATARAHSVPDYFGYTFISSWEVLFLYAIGSDCQHHPCAIITLFFLYAIGSGFAFARARENSIGSVCLATACALSLPSQFVTPIRPYCSTVVDFNISGITCLLNICGSVRISYRLWPLLHRPRSLGCEESPLLPLRIFNYGLAVIFGVRLPTSCLHGVFDSVILRVVCRLRHQLSCCHHFFDLVRYRLITPLLGTYGKDFIWALLPFMVLCRSSHESASGSYSPIVVSCSRKSATFIEPSLGQVDNLPAFPASWHRDGHSVVRNASSWPSVSRWDYMLILRLSAHFNIAHLYGCSTSRGGGHPATACSVARRSLWPTFRRLTPLAAARFCLAISYPLRDDIRVVHARGITNVLLNAMHLSRAGILGAIVLSDVWLVSVNVKELDWPAMFVCAPCPSIRCDWSRATSWVQYCCKF
ncbi:hypothetical protein EDB85DRAFT_2212902 [Lactarius pseudohatsudake]|nr:hypothetical protein EDB85DRAFT_2212902 [Lactarius pseudohatsudake]